MSEENKGLLHKFTVKRIDGSSEFGGKHEHCKFFVLDIDHDPFAVAALRAYAEACEWEDGRHKKFKEFVKDLRKLADNAEKSWNGKMRKCRRCDKEIPRPYDLCAGCGDEIGP